MDYLKKFKNHSEYEAIKNSLLNPNVSYCANQADVHYKVKDYRDEYLTFEALEDGTFSFSLNSIQYSVDDGETWATLTTGNSTPTVAAGETIMWKASGLTPVSNYGIGTFSSTGMFNAKGNVMSLYYGDDFSNENDLSGKNYAFARLLESGKTVNAKDLILPAMTLSDYCYYLFLDRCSNLISAPNLPATTLATSCYLAMFQLCTSLINSPIISATTLSASGMAYMFSACESLSFAPELPITTLTDSCYKRMFDECYSLTIPPELPATTLAKECYYCMFRKCSSLIKTPSLKSTTLVQGCYEGMFEECYCLGEITMLATNISATNCLFDWVSGITRHGTFIKASSMNTLSSGVSGIPSGWVVKDAT